MTSVFLPVRQARRMWLAQQPQLSLQVDELTERVDETLLSATGGGVSERAWDLPCPRSQMSGPHLLGARSAAPPFAERGPGIPTYTGDE